MAAYIYTYASTSLLWSCDPLQNVLSMGRKLAPLCKLHAPFAWTLGSLSTQVAYNLTHLSEDHDPVVLNGDFVDSDLYEKLGTVQ